MASLRWWGLKFVRKLEDEPEWVCSTLEGFLGLILFPFLMVAALLSIFAHMFQGFVRSLDGR